MTQADLFAAPLPAREVIAPQVILLRGFATPTASLITAIEAISGAAPFRHLTTRGGGSMSVAMTNAGAWGWHSDLKGYRYVEVDPLSGRKWPTMPAQFAQLAREAANAAGFASFEPDACLVNRYQPGAQMGSHRDFDEADFSHPIVSVSIGVPATFVWNGTERSGRGRPVTVEDGDVLVWGGVARAGYHGVRKLAPAEHPATSGLRYNLTFRRAK